MGWLQYTHVDVKHRASWMKEEFPRKESNSRWETCLKGAKHTLRAVAANGTFRAHAQDRSTVGTNVEVCNSRAYRAQTETANHVQEAKGRVSHVSKL